MFAARSAFVTATAMLLLPFSLQQKGVRLPFLLARWKRPLLGGCAGFATDQMRTRLRCELRRRNGIQQEHQYNRSYNTYYKGVPQSVLGVVRPLPPRVHRIQPKPNCNGRSARSHTICIRLSASV